MASYELVALSDASTHLLNLQRKLSKVQEQVLPLPGSAIPGRVDDRFSAGVLTRAKKSVLPRDAYNRFASETYPIAPVRVDFIQGANSRHIGRDPVVTWR